MNWVTLIFRIRQGQRLEKRQRSCYYNLDADEVLPTQLLGNNLIQRPLPKHTKYVTHTHTQYAVVCCQQALSFKNKENRRHIEVIDPQQYLINSSHQNLEARNSCWVREMALENSKCPISILIKRVHKVIKQNCLYKTNLSLCTRVLF